MSMRFSALLFLICISITLLISNTKGLSSCSNDVFVTELNNNSLKTINKSVQTLFPKLMFNCSGYITHWEGLVKKGNKLERYFVIQIWRPISGDQYQNIADESIHGSSRDDDPDVIYFNFELDNYMYFQPGDILGIYIPSIDTLSLLYSSNATNGIDMYYTYISYPPCGISLCSSSFQHLEGIELQLKATLNVSDSESIFDQTPDICSNAMNLVVCPDVTQISVTTTVSTSSTFSFSSILVTPSSLVACEGPQCDDEKRNSSQLLLIVIGSSVSFAVVVILISAGIISIFVICRREIRKSTQKVSEAIEHYPAGDGTLYAAVYPRRTSGGSIGINGSPTSVIKNDNTFDEVDGLTPYAELKTHTILSSESNSHMFSVTSVNCNDQRESSPPIIQPYAASMFDLVGPYLQPTRIGRSATVTGVIHQPTPQPYSMPSPSSLPKHLMSQSSGQIFPTNHRSPTNVTNGFELESKFSPSYLPPLGEGVELSGVQPYQTPLSLSVTSPQKDGFSYTEPISFRSNSMSEKLPFPYSEPSPVTIRRISEAQKHTNYHNHIYRSASIDHPAPYMQPSPTTKPKRDRQVLTGKLSVGSTSGIPSTSFIYTPPETLSHQRESQSMTDFDCLNVPSNAIREECEGVVAEHEIYSKLDRNITQSFFDQRNVYWTPSCSATELYDQLADHKYREIPRKKIGISSCIGSGHFGTVHKGIWKFKNGKLVVAVKTLKPDLGEEEKVKFLQEAAIMGQFLHPNIVQLHGVVTIGEPLMICLELMPKGDLKHYLREQNKVYLTIDQDTMPKQLLEFCRQIGCGMNYLASKEFVHRDLAARNIFLNDDLICKIGDFGMTRDLTQDEIYESQGGKIPLKWTAPEAINYRRYTIASDVWSYGMLLHEIWSLGHKPFEKVDNVEILTLVNSGYCQPPPPGCPRSIYKLMVQCWQHTPSERPKFSDIMEYLTVADSTLLQWNEDDSSVADMCTVLGASLDHGMNLFPDLQLTYDKM